MTRIFLATLAVWATLGAAAATEKKEDAELYRPYLEKHRRPEGIEFPADNTFNADRELLGRTLFFDPRLSGSNFISCATCHNPGFAWGDGLPTAIGDNMKPLGRRTPTVLNLAWAGALFWDGRSETLEEQCLGPIRSTAEMNQPLDELVEELRGIAEYEALFENAYPGEGTLEDTIELYDLGGRRKRPSLSPLIKALQLTEAEKNDLAAFLRTLTSADPTAQIPAMPR